MAMRSFSMRSISSSMPRPGQHVGDGRAAVEHAGDARVLRQVAEAALAHDPAGGRLGLAAEHLEQAGLAGAVAADEADLVPGHDGEVGRLDDEPAADLHREPLGLEHRSRVSGRGPRSNRVVRRSCHTARSISRR